MFSVNCKSGINVVRKNEKKEDMETSCWKGQLSIIDMWKQKTQVQN